jgi:protein-S-isoprenylcysteine O-methyltransferase Ste14
MMKRRSTDRNTRWHRMIERWGPRRARLALVLATALYLALMIAVAALLLAQGPLWERKLRVGLVGVLALIALWLWVRVLRAQWGQLRVVTGSSGQDSEDTGIWGVGGPGMRTPGTTGLSRILPRRRAQDAEDSENSP